MFNLRLIYALVLILLCPSSTLAEEAPAALVRHGLIALGEVPQRVEGEFRFTEGPVALPNGSIYFTDQPLNRIYRWEESSGVHLHSESAPRANGLALQPDGRLVACAEETRALVIFAPDGTWEPFATGFEGKPFNSPNDVWRHPAGFFFVTDPVYPRPWAPDRTPTQPVRGVYRVDTEGGVLRVLDDLTQPNGIVGSADGKWLFVSDIAKGKIWKYALDEEALPKQGSVLCEIASDGMTLDERGHLYLTNKSGVTVVSEAGEILGSIPIPEPWTANVAFGGKDLRTLFITASKHVYTVRMEVAGER